MSQFYGNKKPAYQAALAKKIKKAKRKVRLFKLRIFLLITLPIAVVTVGRAVLHEYVKVKVKKAAAQAGQEALQNRRAKGEAPENA